MITAVCVASFFFAAQTPEVPPETPQPTTTTTTDPEQPRDAAPPVEQAPNPPPPEFPALPPEQRGVIVPTPIPVPTTTQPQPQQQQEDGFVHYLSWYGAEYAGVLVVGGLFAAGVQNFIEPPPSLIGPQFDIDNPDLEVLFDPRLDDVIGKPLLKEKVPEAALGVGLAVTALTMTGVDYLATGDLHRTHNLVLGSLETVTGTLLVTETLKLSVGRLRPDFRARYVSAACNGAVDKPEGLACDDVDVAIDREELVYGMESFVSGHSSLSFSMATFTSLWLGSTLVWNADRPSWGPAIGALSIGTLYTLAGVTAGSRLADHRHHPEDVLGGAAVGATIGAVAYFVHFDLDGKARRRSWQVVPTGNGLAVAGVF